MAVGYQPGGMEYMMSKNVMLLGATGSIGLQTLEVVRANPDMRVVSLAARSSIDLLEQQVREFLPKLVCVYLEERALELKRRLSDLPEVEVVSGMDGMAACATMAEGDIVVAAVVGMIGILPVIEAVKAGKDIAFANKEHISFLFHF